MLNKLYDNLYSLRTKDGLYRASNCKKTGYYDYAWLRDTFYCSLPTLKQNSEYYKQTYQTLLDYLKKMETKYNKLSSWFIDSSDCSSYRYLHPRINITTFDEDWSPWSNCQLDSTAYILYGIYLGEENNISIIRNDIDREIIQLLIKYLEFINYPILKESGAWEENREIRSSSLFVCITALKMMNELGFEVNNDMLNLGIKTLHELLPNETPIRDVDMAQLFMLYLSHPKFEILSQKEKDLILHNVESNLVRNHGVIRYKEDYFYNRANLYSAENQKYIELYIPNESQVGNEAEWCMGNSYLSLIYSKLGDKGKAEYYLDKVLCDCKDGKVPELYYAKTDIPNSNSLLGWANAITILAIESF